MRFYASLLVLIISFSGCKDPFSTKHDVEKKAAIIKIDEPLHNKNSLEWWYLTGVLRDEAGNRYGVEYVFFHFLTKDLVQRLMVNVAVTDTKDSVFYYDYTVKTKGKKLNDELPLNFKVKDYSWKGEAGNYELKAQMKLHDIGFNLTTQATQKPTLHGDSGYVYYGDVADAGYFSYARLNTKGQLFLNQDTIMVEGVSWFDRQWNCGEVTSKDVSWDWAGITLDNNTELMLYRVKTKDNPEYIYGGTFTDENKNSMVIPHESIQVETSNYWKSSESKKEYPLDWKINIEELDLSLSMKAVMPNQELVIKNPFNKLPYWEGLCDVEGTINGEKVKGESYLEMTNK